MINENRGWVEGVLKDLDFVEWDRFTSSNEKKEPDIIVFGWIPRENDGYKDFVLITFYPIGHMISYTTSSSLYSTKIGEILFGPKKTRAHIPCQRVEHFFDVENSIKIPPGDEGLETTDRTCPQCEGRLFRVKGTKGYYCKACKSAIVFTKDVE